MGKYDGDRQLSLNGDQLVWERPDRPALQLIPLAGRTFALGDRFGPRIEIDASGSAVTITRPGTPPEQIARVRGS